MSAVKLAEAPSRPSSQSVTPPVNELLKHVAAAYTVRHVNLDRAVRLGTSGTPRAGDLVLAEVTSIGHHSRLESVTSRRVPLTVGDRVIVAYGQRYAPDQFESVVPEDLGPCELVAGGGIAARVVSRNERVKEATTLNPVGFLLDHKDERLNTADGARIRLPVTSKPPLMVLVTGSSMNAGKTTTAALTCRGFLAAGLRVGAAKITGTSSGNDVWSLHDTGARPVLDFTDFGHPSSRGLALTQIVDVLEQTLSWIAADDCDVAVIEVADGVLHEETAAVLQHPVVRAHCDAVLFAASDALSAIAGVDWLTERGIDTAAVSGMVSTSPLATRELQGVRDIEVWGRATLTDPAHAREVYARLHERREAREGAVL